MTSRASFISAATLIPPLALAFAGFAQPVAAQETDIRPATAAEMDAFCAIPGIAVFGVADIRLERERPFDIVSCAHETVSAEDCAWVAGILNIHDVIYRIQTTPVNDAQRKIAERHESRLRAAHDKYCTLGF